jgi:5'(3')-deoxyribonucleotidase
MRRPVVLLDVDGILADFIGAALRYLFDQSGTVVPYERVRTWEIFDSIPPELQGYKDSVYDRFRSHGACTSICPYEGSRMGVHHLHGLAEVVIVTSPFPGSETWMYEREQWLKFHYNIARDHIIHACSKHYVKGDIFVDDKASHVISWAEAHPTGMSLLWSAPTNEHEELPDTVSRVAGWDQLLARVYLWIRSA